MNTIVSAGGLIIKEKFNKQYVLLIEYANKVFGFPKGRIKSGETTERTAIREVGEETGLNNLTVVRNLGTIKRFYNKGSKIKKTIVLFLIKANNYSGLNTGQEVCRWFELEQVEKVLKYRADQNFFNRIKKHIKAK